MTHWTHGWNACFWLCVHGLAPWKLYELGEIIKKKLIKTNLLFKLNKRSKLSILFWKSIVPANSAAIQFNNSAFYHPLKCHPKKSHFWQQKSKKKFHCQSSRIEWNQWTKTCLTTIEYWLYFFFSYGNWCRLNNAHMPLY